MNKINNHFPVNILLPNASQLFEILCDKYELTNNFDNGLSKKLKNVCTDNAINDIAQIREHYDNENIKYYQIAVWENYCQFLWTICYSSMVYMDELIIKPFLDPNMNRDDLLLEKATKLFEAGMSLFHSDSTLRANINVFFELTNPIEDKDDKYVKSANLLFEASLCFVLFHEYHHFNLGHIDKEHVKNDEIEADFCAFFSMYGEKSLEKRKFSSLGCIIALSSLLFVDNTLDGGTHPDPDDRLSLILNNMDDLDEQGKDYCYGMATTFYKMWAFYYKVKEIIPKVDKAENYKEYFNIIQKAFNDYKKK